MNDDELAYIERLVTAGVTLMHAGLLEDIVPQLVTEVRRLRAIEARCLKLLALYPEASPGHGVLLDALGLFQGLPTFFPAP